MRDWNAEHERGAWSFLSDRSEQGRLAIVAAYAAMFADHVIVDVGCADGQLRKWLDREKFGRYIGIDIARSAFTKAETFSIETEWLESSIEAYQPSGTLPGSGLIFSEVLYYVSEPARQVQRLCQALQPACMIVSMAVPGSKYPRYEQDVEQAWSAIKQLEWPTLASSLFTDEFEGNSWRILALRPL